MWLPISPRKLSKSNLFRYFSIKKKFLWRKLKVLLHKRNNTSNFLNFKFPIFLDYIPLVLQEAAYESASSPSQGIFSKLVSVTEERPWLWVVYVLSILIPVIIIAVICFGRKSRPVTQDYKKTDEVSHVLGSLITEGHSSICFKLCRK